MLEYEYSYLYAGFNVEIAWLFKISQLHSKICNISEFRFDEYSYIIISVCTCIYIISRLPAMYLTR